MPQQRGGTKRAPLPAARHEFTLWRHRTWRCEFWVVGVQGHLRVFDGKRMHRDEEIVDATESLRKASRWLQQVKATGTLAPK